MLLNFSLIKIRFDHFDIIITTTTESNVLWKYFSKVKYKEIYEIDRDIFSILRILKIKV